MRGNRLLEGTFKPKFETEYDIAKYKFMSLIMMQLLSVLFQCKLYSLFSYYFRIFKLTVKWQFLDSYLSTRLLFSFLKYLIRITLLWNHFFLQYPKFLTRLPFVLTFYLFTDTRFILNNKLLIGGFVIQMRCQNCLRYLVTIVKRLTLSKYCNSRCLTCYFMLQTGKKW